MTGAFIRIKRDGKWTEVEIDKMTNDELDQFASEYPERGWMWAKFLAKYIRDFVKTDSRN